MADEQQQSGLDGLHADMDAGNLYEVKVVTDRKAGSIRVLTPITKDGQPDPSRKTIFTGEAQMMTQVGALPIGFEIPGETIGEAVANYSAAAKKGIEDTLERLRELRREAASQIVTPGMPGFQAPPDPGSGSGLVMP